MFYKVLKNKDTDGLNLRISKLFLLIVLLINISFQNIARAEDLDSANFTIFDNGINAGGARSTSSNFILESTLGEISGTTTSTNYSSRSGFQAIEPEPKMSMTISSNVINLGALSTGSVSFASLTVSVTTNAPSGYGVRITEDDNLHSGSNTIDDVADGAVTAGSEEYGIGTTGSAGQFNSADTAISGSVTVAANAGRASAEQTTVTFRASMSPLTYNGSYSHVVTFTAVANF